ncbi:putative Diguanylate cyclase VdcA [Desulfosarcina cetonica]|uniref:GGDEF domain-containing protein n=1 Tax=Desulfosarcina cetonica TaxID=90730 RepID=UPI0006D28DF4|nr:GGDEF domain-containing protein [Desulfosarcina cetonica]VTR67533.1 putative Diguanylate cyclase VdcA [Desulfosarcina cetonica]
MYYEDTLDTSRQYLRLALERLGKYGLPTDPLNYCVWYEYASGRNEALNACLDAHVEGNGHFSADMLRQLYNQHIIGHTEAVSNRVREELKKVFAEIIGAIKTTRQNFSTSENNLESINDALVPHLPEADVENLVNRIKDEIKCLESSSSAFREQLQQATREIDQLKLKMARYRKEALKDPLTRIANRRGFTDALKLAIQKSEASKSALCLIIADIDHFKKINDTHGHLVGDNVLRMVAATIKESVKGRDLVARIGGEEFAVLLPDTPLEGAVKLGENMRRTFNELDLKKKNSGESLGQVTLSFGVTLYQPDETAEAFIQRADKALYASKENGRNRVTCF